MSARDTQELIRTAVERFTEHFWGLIGFWRKTDADRLSRDGTRDDA